MPMTLLLIKVKFLCEMIDTYYVCVYNRDMLDGLCVGRKEMNDLIDERSTQWLKVKG